MSLEPIILDDLNWSDMVVAIRRRIAAASGETWTLHAPVDPGITLLELFAWLLEQRVYWMDQVPDALVRGAISMLGQKPKATQAATTVMHFPGIDLMRVVGPMTELTLQRSNPPLVFSTGCEVVLLPFERLANGREKIGLHIAAADRTTDLERGMVMRLFEANGKSANVKIVLWLRDKIADDVANKHFSLLFDLKELPGTVPQWLPGAPEKIKPPARISWSYRGPNGFVPFADDEVIDGTGGLRRSGVVTLPIKLKTSDKSDWQPLPPDETSHSYRYELFMNVAAATFSFPPRVERIVPNVAIASHQRKTKKHLLHADWLPLPGNTIALAELGDADRKDYPPIENTIKLQIRERDQKWHLWRPTRDLAFHGPADRVFIVDRPRGELSFGDGLTGRVPVLAELFQITTSSIESLRNSGVSDEVVTSLAPLIGQQFTGRNNFMTALKRALGEKEFGRFQTLFLKHAGEPQFRLQYCVGGGVSGNLGADLDWERADLQATNLVQTEGGKDPETTAAAKERTAATLKESTRAVTADDYEEIARTTPGVGIKRAHAAIGLHPAHPCVPIPGAVTVFVVPGAPRPDKLSEDFDASLMESGFVSAPMPDPGALAMVRARLETTRLAASEVFVSAPVYRQFDLTIEAESNAVDQTTLREGIKRRLYTFFDPLIGGVDGDGWPFGEPLHPSAILREAQRVLGDQGNITEVLIELSDVSVPDKRVIVNAAPLKETSCLDIAVRAHELVELRNVIVRFHHSVEDQGGLR